MTLTSAPPVVRPRTTSLVFTLLGLGAGTFAMLQSLLSPVLPTLQHDLGTTQAGVSWVLIAWLLSASVATPILGRVGDMIGKHRALLVVLGAIAVGSLVAALAPSIGVMVVGRIIQGLGGAIYPISFGIIRDEYPAHRVPRAVGAMSSVIAVGGGIGTVLAGPISDGLGWRWLFGIPLLLVLAIGALAARFVPTSPVRSGGRINWAAGALLAVWLVALLLPLSLGSSWGWLSGRTLGAFALAAVSFAAWVTLETRSANPLIDMRMMRQRAVWTTNLVALLFGAAMFAVITFLPQFIQTPPSAGYGFGSSVTVAGLLVLPTLAAMAVGGMASGPIHHVVGFRAQLAYGSALLLVGCLGFAFWHDTAWQVALGGVVFGLGLGLAYAAMTSVIVHTVAPAMTGAATGMNTNIRTIGGAIGTALVSAIITGSAGETGTPTATGYTTAFATLAAIAALGVVLSLLIPTARGRT
ncbi:MFS transporter [Asanoa siamensis]|uniref:MFS transporter n=1 Tax=Asanoa siamensis TaxID=926357 RepID=A0ABQ4CJZ3_9ACTN|nr:MFS transporter [Asanoa siamensis]GIF71609.1 MFS transporter [Asanoa siamensis]